jgi:hypothetical protein
MESETMKEKLGTLADEVKDLSNCESRLEATVRALSLYKDILESSKGPEGTGEDVHRILEIAREMGDYGFTLDELIRMVGPEMLYFPRRYKNKLSSILREAGFRRTQVRRNGERPLVWWNPE